MSDPTPPSGGDNNWWRGDGDAAPPQPGAPVPPGQSPYRQAPQGPPPGQVPGQAPYSTPGQPPYGQIPPDQTLYGQGPPGQGPHGQIPPGQAPYGQGPPGQGPHGQIPPGQAPYGQPTGQGPYGAPGQGGPYRPDDTRPLFGQPGQPPYGNVPPGHGFAPGQFQPGFPGGPQQPGGPGKPSRRKPWIFGGAAALVVALVAGGAVALTSGGDDDVAVETGATTSTTSDPTAPIPSGSFTDGLSSTAPTPKSAKTPAERKRTVKDIDAGIAIYDDVYIQPARGWKKEKKTKDTVWLLARGKGVVLVAVDPFGVDAFEAVPHVVSGLVKADRLTGVNKGPARKLKPANSNIAGEAQQNFSGRLHTSDGVTLSLVGKCTTITGVESIHNVTVSVCIEALKSEYTSAFRDYAKMLASVTRSI